MTDKERFSVVGVLPEKTPAAQLPFRKGSDVAAAVDTAFDELKADGTMGALAEKYGLTLAE